MYQSTHPLDQDMDSANVQEENPFAPSDEEYEDKIRKKIHAYRLTYLCKQSYSGFCQYRQRRTPHGLRVYLSLLLIFLERLAYYSVVGNITDPFLRILKISGVYRSLIQTALFDGIAQLMFPIAGFLGDRFIGRHRTVHISMWLLWIGYASLTFVSSFSDKINHINTFFLPLCFVFIAMGSAGFQANMIPFGADQIVGRPSDELSSYFYWYYWARNLGAVLLIVSFTCPFDYHAVVLGMFSTVSISIALLVNQFFHRKFHIDQERHNPLKYVVQVMRFVATIKRPKLRSAFSYTGAPPPSRMDLAKEIHGGKFTNAQVEDVKTFLRLLVVLLSLMGVLIVYTGVVNVIALQVKQMNGSFVVPSTHNTCSFSDSSVWVFNIGLILVIIPIINFCVYPFLREYTPNMQKRIGIGYVLIVLSPLILLVISSVGYGISSARGDNSTLLCLFAEDSKASVDGYTPLPINSGYVTIPHLIVSLAEVFVIISCLEFFYAQSPHTMRGMMVGLFFFTWGVSTVIANLFVIFFSNIEVFILTSGIWYYTVLVVLAVVTFVGFLFVSRWYKNRQRGDLQPELYYRQQPF